MSTSALSRPGLIKPPGPRLRKHIPLKFISKHGAGGRKSSYAELNLTSMVDMLTILVVFLLQTFSASGELLTVSKNITLPEAINYKDLEQAPIIAVSRDSVTLNGDPKADSQELSRENTVDWKIPQLHDDLVVLKNNFKLLHPNPEDWKGLVIVQADKNIDFKVIKKVMYTCAVAGYNNVNFAVQSRGKGGG
ncbi:MAG: biopolymer transporter ExbD [Myxococcales bacterium]|nr:biopolymer transporter ExbD [Myxococcales bacterium]